MGEKKVTGIILSGGKSRRMGSEKGLVLFRGKAMIEYAVEALLPVCDQIIISANSSSYAHLGFEVVKDEFPDSGPMGGIYSGLKKSKNEVNFLLSCDMPFITSNEIYHILELGKDCDIAVPWHETARFEPLCAVYKKSLLPEFERYLRAGKLKMVELIQNVNAKKILTGKEGLLNPDIFFNINSMKELEAISTHTFVKPLAMIPNLMLIAGTGRNVGKTTFACQLIQQFSKTHEVVGIKISPHLHVQAKGQKILAGDATFQIIEETNPDLDKDSSRMLRAGATRVFYLQTGDKNIREPFEQLLEMIPKNHPVICESGALLNYARPALFVIIKRMGETAFKEGVEKLAYSADAWVEFDGNSFDTGCEGFTFSPEGWSMVKTPDF